MRAALHSLFYVYILASKTRVLYIGITNDLSTRIHEHRTGIGSSFCFRYNVFRLVHVEPYADVRAAIAREKELKGWRRSKKVALIAHANPEWRDLLATM